MSDSDSDLDLFLYNNYGIQPWTGDWIGHPAGIASPSEQAGSWYDGYVGQYSTTSSFPEEAFHASSFYPDELTNNLPTLSNTGAPFMHPADAPALQPPISIKNVPDLPPELTEKLRNATRYNTKTVARYKENNEGSYWVVNFVGCSEACFVCKKRTNSGEICGQICTSSSGINKHFLSKIHETGQTDFYYCDHPKFRCDARFARKDAWKRHREAGSLHRAPTSSQSGGSQQ